MTITMRNIGGVLDSRRVEIPVDAIQVVIDMMMTAGELHAGDVIEISDDD